MATTSTQETPYTKSILDEKLEKSSVGKWGGIVFAVMLVAGLIYIATQLSSDLAIVHSASVFPFVLLGIALLIALGFEFVNGFHDTANAVATVIYTHSLEPHIAVVYSGIMNFVGVLTSSGSVAFAVIVLLPVELILQVSSGAGFAMVFALLIAAILWNLATWWRGLPASSSHTMIGSIIGVGVANQIMQGNSGTAGVDWSQVQKVFLALFWSPVIAVSSSAADAVSHYVVPTATVGDAEPELEHFVSVKTYQPSVMLALQQEITNIRNEVTLYGSLKGVPASQQANVRNQMYLTSETLRLLPKAKGSPKFSDADTKTVANYNKFLNDATKFIPTWVKVAVALALGLGTMVGWKRIVVTVGEKIGKTHMTYAQGATAELITMATILGADHLGVPVSTTHILNSGVAGTMAANRSGLQLSTVRDIALAWIFTLPAAALLSGCLFFIFNKMVGH